MMIKILQYREGCLRGKTKGYLVLRQEERWIRMDSVFEARVPERKVSCS